LTLSLIVGAGNMLTFMADTSGRAKKKAAALDVPTEEQEEIVESVEEEASSSMGASLVLVQVSTFLLGMILYVTFISWMLLPEIIVGGF
jgi:hypothetical protein